MTHKTLRHNLITLLALIFVSTLLFACKKEKPSVVKIQVVDIEGNTVNNASVRLYATSTTTPMRPPIIDDTMITKSDGIAIFDYSDHFNLGQAGLMVLDIEVIADDLFGTGIVKIEEEKTNNETVIIQ